MLKICTEPPNSKTETTNASTLLRVASLLLYPGGSGNRAGTLYLPTSGRDTPAFVGQVNSLSESIGSSSMRHPDVKWVRGGDGNLEAMRWAEAAYTVSCLSRWGKLRSEPRN